MRHATETHDAGNTPLIGHPLDSPECPVAQAILMLFVTTPSGVWSGSPAELLEAISDPGVSSKAATESPSWPRSPQALALALGRIEHVLRHHCYEVSKIRDGAAFYTIRSVATVEKARVRAAIPPERLAEIERATAQARAMIKPGDAITRTACMGLQETFHFRAWEGDWMCGNTSARAKLPRRGQGWDVYDCAAIDVVAVNGQPVDFGALAASAH